MKPYLFFFSAWILAFMSMPAEPSAQDALKKPIVKITALNEYGQEDDGTGVVVGKTGNEIFILTAAHVIPLPDDIQATFFEGPTVSAQVVQANSSLDIAVVKCRLKGSYEMLASFAVAKADEKALQSVIVIGHPLGNNWDVNFNANVKETEFDFDPRLFTLAPIGIAPGNSGGPVLSQQYELLGLVQNVDPVKAVCVDMPTIIKACQAWDVPTDLLTGITVKQTQADAGTQDFRYQLFLQEANTAFAAGKWEQAKGAYEQANVLAASAELQSKIEQCLLEMAKDQGYETAKQKGLEASDLQASLKHFEKARSLRDTKEIRELIKMVRDRLANLELEAATLSTGDLPEKFSDPLAGDFVLVKGGMFEMGEWGIAEPPHKVAVSDFYMGVHEVTVKQFAKFLNDRGHHMFFDGKENEEIRLIIGFKVNGDPIKNFGIRKVGSDRNRYRPFPEYTKHPQRVAWSVADLYCQWLSSKTGYTYRLPTEAEWEYAAGGGHRHEGKKTVFSGSNSLKEVTIDNDATCNLPRSVKTRAPNELGIYDMTGNVSEWCSDNYSEDYYAQCQEQGVVIDPKGPEESIKGRCKVIKGSDIFCLEYYITYSKEEQIEDYSIQWRDCTGTGYYHAPGAGIRLVREPYKAGSQNVKGK